MLNYLTGFVILGWWYILLSQYLQLNYNMYTGLYAKYYKKNQQNNDYYSNSQQQRVYNTLNLMKHEMFEYIKIRRYLTNYMIVFTGVTFLSILCTNITLISLWFNMSIYLQITILNCISHTIS